MTAGRRGRRHLTLPVLLIAVVVVAWAAVSLGFAGAGTAVRVAATVAAAVTVAAALASIPAARPPAASAFEHALRPPPARAAEVPATLERIRRATLLSVTGAGSLHYRLRPMLREVATHRLRLNHRVELDSDPAAARDRLGATAFDLVRADRPRPEDRLAPGIRPDDLAEVVRALEEL